jgi:hypothetical protein
VAQNSKPDGVHPEPEIIPPDRAGGPRPHGNAHIWISMTDANGQRTYRTPGPFTVVATILVAALVLMLVLGALLIWVPLIAILLAGFIVVGVIRGYFRGYFQRPR